MLQSYIVIYMLKNSIQSWQVMRFGRVFFGQTKYKRESRIWTRVLLRRNGY